MARKCKSALKAIEYRVNVAESAMSRLKATFKQGDNRFGQYGRNCREAFDMHAKVWAELTGKPVPSIYD